MTGTVSSAAVAAYVVRMATGSPVLSAIGPGTPVQAPEHSLLRANSYVATSQPQYGQGFATIPFCQFTYLAQP